MTKVFEKQITAAQVLSAKHFYELCCSFNFSVALGADSRVEGWRPLSDGGSPKAWHDGVQSRFIYFANILSPELLRDAKGPTVFRSGVKGRTVVLVRQICTVRSATIVSRGYHPRTRPRRWSLFPPIDTHFWRPFCRSLAEDIASRFVFFLPAKRERSAENGIVSQTCESSLDSQT